MPQTQMGPRVSKTITMNRSDCSSRKSIDSGFHEMDDSMNGSNNSGVGDRTMLLSTTTASINTISISFQNHQILDYKTQFLVDSLNCQSLQFNSNPPSKSLEKTSTRSWTRWLHFKKSIDLSEIELVRF